jgi:hypothetical protein
MVAGSSAETACKILRSRKYDDILWTIQASAALHVLCVISGLGVVVIGSVRASNLSSVGASGNPGLF